MHVQWATGCEAAISHSWLPTVNMSAPETRRPVKNQPRGGQCWIIGQVSVCFLKVSCYRFCRLDWRTTLKLIKHVIYTFIMHFAYFCSQLLGARTRTGATEIYRSLEVLLLLHLNHALKLTCVQAMHINIFWTSIKAKLQKICIWHTCIGPA